MKRECDTCGKLRTDVRAIGRDAIGEPDAPCCCFFCRKRFERGEVYCYEHRRFEQAFTCVPPH